jgi:hypothetical protein
MTPPRCKVCGSNHWGPCFVPEAKSAPRKKATKPKVKNARPAKRKA